MSIQAVETEFPDFYTDADNWKEFFAVQFIAVHAEQNPARFLKERTRAGRLLEVEEFCSNFADREAEILRALRQGDRQTAQRLRASDEPFRRIDEGSRDNSGRPGG